MAARLSEVSKDIGLISRPEPRAHVGDGLFSNVVANIPGAIYRCSARDPRPAQLLSEGIEEICGHPAEAFVRGGLMYSSLILDEDRPSVEARLAEAVAANATYALEYRIRHGAGGVRWVLERGRGVYADDGELLWLDGVIFDVSARKLAEEAALRLNQELREAQRALEAANQSLAEQAVTDYLTGVPNQRAMRARLAELVAEARRGRRFAAVMVDVDGFKPYNDSYGHLAGDEALIRVVRELRHGLRDVDLVSRYGGDEFCLLLVDVDEAAACRLAERCRQRVAAIADLPRELAATFGVAAYETAMGASGLLEAADQALYKAKRAGRNRVVGYRR